MPLIILDASPTSNFDWEVNGEGTYFLDFALQNLDPFDEGQFSARFLAVQEFARRFPKAKEVILARFDGKFFPLLTKSEKFEITWKESQLNKEVYSAQLLSEYLHRLASALGENTLPIILCEISFESKLEELILPLCRRRFEHFAFHFSQQKIPLEGSEKIAVALPQDEMYDTSTFSQILHILEGKEYKCIPEELLNEHWDGVDVVIVEPNSLGETGKRMLLGFEAAGGTILYAEGKNWAKQLDHLALMSE